MSSGETRRQRRPSCTLPARSMDKLFLAMSFPDLLAKLGSQNILCGSFWPFSFAAYCDKCGRLRQCPRDHGPSCGSDGGGGRALRALQAFALPAERPPAPEVWGQGRAPTRRRARPGRAPPGPRSCIFTSPACRSLPGRQLDPDQCLSWM